MSIIEKLTPKGISAHRFKTARGQYDFAVNGGVQGTIALMGGTLIPAASIIIGGFIYVTTAVTSLGAATVAVQCEAAGDIVATTGKATWTTGLKTILPADTTGSIAASPRVLTSAVRDISIVIATADLTAGKFDVVLHYIDPLS